MPHEFIFSGETLDRPTRTAVGRPRGVALLGVLFAAATLLSGCGPSEPTKPCPPACNVLLISIDTLAAKRMSLYGYERETTPKKEVRCSCPTASSISIETTLSNWSTGTLEPRLPMSR